MTRIAGIVPAAGLSSRMGRTKALLMARGLPFLERVARAFREGGCDLVAVVVRDLDGPEARLAEALGLDVVLNPDPSEGPITSLRAALATLPADVGWCGWCPVDHPLVEAATVTRLIATARKHPNCIVVPSLGGERGHPVIFPRAVFNELMERDLIEGARGVVRKDASRVIEIAVDDPGVIADIDTPDQYAEHLPEDHLDAGSP
jgi:molybdenum cofactor cytidylyltransferase